MRNKANCRSQQAELAAQVAQEARETFPELFTGKTDQEIINKIAEVERKYAHLTIEEKIDLLTPENKQKVREKTAELLEQQAREETQHE